MWDRILKINYILQPKERCKLLFLLLASVFLGVSEMLGLGVLIPILNLFLYPETLQKYAFVGQIKAFLGAETDTDLLKMLILGAIFLFFFKMAYSLWVRYIQALMIGQINARLADDVLRFYIRKDYLFHLESNPATLFRNLTREVNNCISILLNYMLMVLVELVLVVSVLILLLLSYPQETFLAGSVIISVVGLIFLSMNKSIKKAASDQNVYSELFYKTAMETLQGIKDIKVNEVSDYFVGLFSQQFWQYARNFINFSFIGNFPRYFVEAFIMSLFLLAVLWTIQSGQNPNSLISVLAVMAVAAVRILPSIVTINQNINFVQYYSASVDTVYDIIKDFQEVTPIVEQELSQNYAPISLRHFCFSYPQAESAIFEDFNIVISPKSTTAIVGESGSGKSTLIDVIMGLLLAQKGDLFYGETPIRENNMRAFRQKIGYVPQQIFLYDATLAQNIAFGEEKIDTQKLEKAIAVAQLEDVVATLPQGIHTPIGEKGVRLSGGQRQRIGIARALYRQPEILIFDEASSALDNNTEVEVNRAIKSLDKNITIILVAHRLQTIAQADYIYVLDKGKIADSGTFQELEKCSPIFQKITQIGNNAN